MKVSSELLVAIVALSALLLYLMRGLISGGARRQLEEVGMRGAGGSEGGLARFFIGLAMLVGGGYLFFNSIHVTYGFSMGRAIFRVGGIGLTSGMVLFPFIFGVGMIFYNSKNIVGWVLCGASLVMLGFGVISSIDFRMQRMSAFNLLMILTLFIGGLGLFLSSLRGLGDDDRGRYDRGGRDY